MKKSVLLIGGRSKAKSLASSLLAHGYHVTAINMNHDDCLYLANDSRLNVIYGDGTKPYVLEEASAASANIAIALTSQDEDNLVACTLCKNRFHVSKTVSLLSDPQKKEFFYKMGIDRVVCSISAITGIIEQQAFMDEISRTIPLGAGRIQISEIFILANAPAVGKKLLEIDLPKEVIIGCILRGEATMIPRGETRIHAGDTLIMISSSGQETDAIYTLTGERTFENKDK